MGGEIFWAFSYCFGLGTEWVEGIFVIVLLRNFLKLFLILMAKWVNGDFSLGSLCFSFEQPKGKTIIFGNPLCLGLASDWIVNFSSGWVVSWRDCGNN
jgi:hypothetical protein